MKPTNVNNPINLNNNLPDTSAEQSSTVNVNQALLDIPIKDLIPEISQRSTAQDSTCIQFLINRIETISRYESRSGYMATAFKTPQKIPLDEIFKLLKDSYNGKFNDYLQEILSSAEIEVLVKNIPNDTNEARYLEVKIKLAAAVIDKYADLLTMVLGGTKALGDKIPKEHKDIIQNSSMSLKMLNDQLNGINLIFLISKMKAECQRQVDIHRGSHCLPFFCSGKKVNNLNVVETILNSLIREGFVSAEIMGGLLLLDLQVKAVFGNDKVGQGLSHALKQLFSDNNFQIEKTNVNEMVKAYVTRAEQLEVKWPEPFSLEKQSSMNALLEIPRWAPGFEIA
jgi:hypothetical protein